MTDCQREPSAVMRSTSPMMRMQRVLILVALCGAGVLYLLRCLTVIAQDSIEACVARAASRIEQRDRERGVRIPTAEWTVVTMPSGEPLADATVEVQSYWSQTAATYTPVPPLTARTTSRGIASIVVGNSSVRVGDPVRVRVTDALGRRAYSGVVLFDECVVLSARDLASIAIGSNTGADAELVSISLHTVPGHGVAVPQLLDRVSCPGGGLASITGYWAGERTLKYSMTCSWGSVTGELSFDHDGKTILIVPAARQSLTVRAMSDRAPVSGAEVSLMIASGGAVSVVQGLTDSQGRWTRLTPWNAGDSGSLRVTHAGFVVQEKALTDEETREEVLCDLKATSTVARLVNKVVDDNGDPLRNVHAALLSGKREEGNETIHDSCMTNEHGEFEHAVSAGATKLYVRLSRDGYCSQEVAWPRATECPTVLLRGSTLRIRPRGLADNAVYSCWPVRYFLQSRSGADHRIGHATSPYSFMGIPPGQYYIHVAIGGLVAYGRTTVNVSGHEDMDVEVPCTDPGWFTLQAGSWSIDNWEFLSGAIPRELPTAWSDACIVAHDSEQQGMQVCAFGMIECRLMLIGRARNGAGPSRRVEAGVSVCAPTIVNW